MKRIVTLLICFVMVLSAIDVKRAYSANITTPVSNWEFHSILPFMGVWWRDVVLANIERVNIGKPDGHEKQRNLNFVDMINHIWAMESVARNGALDIIKGFESYFYPEALATKADAISHVMRALGWQSAGTDRERNVLEEMPEIQRRLNNALTARGVEPLWPDGAEPPLAGVINHFYMELAYMYFASQIGIITPAEYNTIFNEAVDYWVAFRNNGEEVANFIADNSFAFNMHRSPVTREEIASYIYLGLLEIDDNVWINPARVPPSVQHLYTYSDWAEIQPDNLIAVEAMLRNNIMSGFAGAFMPRENVTRAVLSVILRGLNSIYYDLMNYRANSGIIVAINESERWETNYYIAEREFFILTANGTIQTYRYISSVRSDGRIDTMDAVVFKNHQVTGMQQLEVGDVIEYITDHRLPDFAVMRPNGVEVTMVRPINSGSGPVPLAPITTIQTGPVVRDQIGWLLYIEVKGQGTIASVEGVLQSTNLAGPAKSLTIDTAGMPSTYNLLFNLGGVQNGERYLYMHGLNESADGLRVTGDDLPYGHRVRLHLWGNIIMAVEYIGAPVNIPQGSGVVLENNPAFGYMTILVARDESGGLLNVDMPFRYFENDMVVHRREHYETANISYLAQVFPHFGFHPLVTTISQVEPGDLVFFQTDPEQPDVITQISAVTNYHVRYGKVISINGRSGFTEILVEYESGATSWFSVANGIWVTRDGRQSSIHHLVVGDWVRLLVNDAVIAPGIWTETVKELNIEGPERHISGLVKGSLQRIDTIQWRMIVENAMHLDRARGWTSYQNLQTFDLSGRDVEFYHDSTRITRDQAARFSNNTNMTVYIALEQNFSGDRIKKVTFRDNRDTALAPDTVISAFGGGSFEMLSQQGSITSDEGTIIVRHGRLVSQRDIYPGDFVSVVLNGDGRAAIVNVTEPPATNMLMFARGRVLTIEENHAGRGFSVRGQSALNGTSWSYTPVERIYEIDHRTVFQVWDGAGRQMNFETMRDYTASSVIGEYYTIVAAGSHAAFVVDAPFANGAIRGTIYEIGADGFGIRNVEYQERLTGIWRTMPSVDNQIAMRNAGTNTWSTVHLLFNTLQVAVHPGTLIARENQIVLLNNLNVGDRVEIMTTEIINFGALPFGAVTGGPYNVVDGWIVKINN